MVQHCSYIFQAQVFLLFTIRLLCHSQKNGLKVIYEWKTVDYEWSCEKRREEAIRNQKYIPLNIAVWDVDVFYPCEEEWDSCAETEKTVFVTTPRIKPGTPATLSTVSKETRNGSHLLKPFPSWSYNREGNCDGITSVYRTYLDECGRIWVLDTGAVNDFAFMPQIICSAKVIIFDVKSGGELIGMYPIPERVLGCFRYLITIIVDTRDGECDNSFAYIADAVASRLIVFSLRTKMFSRAASNNMYPYPQYGNFDIAGVKFSYMDAITGLSLGPVYSNDRILYYHSLSSVIESYVRTSVIQDQKAFLENERSYPYSFFSFPEKRISQSGPEVMTDAGIMFFSLMTPNAIACWNPQLDPKMKNTPIVAQNNITMQFISGMKVFGFKLFVLSARLQNFYFGSVSASEVNYRILYGCVPQLIKGTTCENKNL